MTEPSIAEPVPASIPESRPELSIVTVLWKSRQFLEPFLDSIRQQRDAHSTEIILVDNDSGDGSVEYLHQRAAELGDVRVIENQVNVGYPTGINRGVSQARGRDIVICNPDLVFREGAIDAMVAELHSAPDIGGVGPIIEVPGDPIAVYPQMRNDPGLYYGWNFFSGFMARFGESRLVNWNLDYACDAESADVPWLHGCCGVFRREALNSVGGGYDERFFLYFEDADLGRCLRRKGWRQRMTDRARVLHLEEQSVKQVKVQTRIWFMESWHLYQRKHHGRLHRSLSFLLVLTGLSLQLALQLAKRLLARPAPVSVIAAYLRTHLSAPFRNLERERESKVESLKARWATIAEPAPRMESPTT